MNKLNWIKVCNHAPYFEEEGGTYWMPIGQNDAIIWPELKGIFQRRNLQEAEEYLAYIAAHGVTCLRIMLEYCQTENRYLERPAGHFQRHMVQFWDDLFELCEKYNLRILLTPFDTFWMARRWNFHPYNIKNGGPCKSKWQWLSDSSTRTVIKNRFTFAITRWGGSGVIFGWDLWNEIHPKHHQKNTEGLADFITDISCHIRAVEMKYYGKSHLQTVSVFAPDLDNHDMHDLVFRTPSLDFATTHFYRKREISSPATCFDAAVATGKLVKYALDHMSAGKPFLDSEHGPIDYFRRNRKNLPEAFDDAYFLHMQWAHMASGGAGGGMRWPYRHPHTLTHGMRCAQANLSAFVKLLSWNTFDRKNISNEVKTDIPSVMVFACGNASQAVVWLLNKNTSDGKTTHRRKTKISQISIPDLSFGEYQFIIWDTRSGLMEMRTIRYQGKTFGLNLDISAGNIALAVVPVSSLIHPLH